MKILVLKLALFSLLVCSCDRHGTWAQYQYQNPDSLSDGLGVASLDDVQMNARPIKAAVNKILSGRYAEVHSMLIFKDGKLVLEEYFQGHDYQWDAPGHHSDLLSWDRDMPHFAHSVSKSVTAICMGMAIDQGFIKSAQESIFEYLPEHQHLRTAENQGITIEHMLTGTSGLQWAEWNAPLSSRANDQVGIYFHEPGPVDFVLSRPLTHPPGSHFVYSGGNFEVLAVVLENATGMSFQEFSRQYLFDPLGMDSAHWHLYYPTGEVHAAGGLRITPREMLKIGVCMLNGGTWGGNRIISGSWIENCALPYAGNHGINVPGEPSGKVGYSYSWWTKDYSVGGRDVHMYAAGGWGGQHIMVLPELDMVVVFTGGNYLTRRPPYLILENYILPAIE